MNQLPLILIADDDPDYLFLVVEMLGDRFQVETAEDGNIALKSIKKRMPDLVLLDVEMPGLTGYELCKILKDDEKTQMIPVVLVTGSSAPEDLLKGFRLGADDYLTKPYNHAELIARCNAMLRIKQLTDELTESNRLLEIRVEKQVAKIERISQLQRYFSPQMVESIIASNGGDSFGDIPQRKEVTIFFCDIRDFTQLADSMRPEEIKSILDCYLELITEVIFKHHGTINKFLGDGVLAIFGDPVPIKDPALCAIHSAVEIRRRLSEINIPKIAQPNNLRIGFGIHSGSVVIGNLGVGQHIDYTVIGASVNMAARLQAFSKDNEVIVTTSTYSPYYNDLKVINERTVQIKGFDDEVQIAEIDINGSLDCK